MSMKKIIFIVFSVILILGLSIYFIKFRNPEPEFTLAEVTRGNVSQEIAETGQVEAGEEINLSFKNIGRVEKIYVNVGDEVTSSQKLAELDKSQLLLQLEEAESNASAQRARLQELKSGARPEDIQISQTLLNKAKSDLNNLYDDLIAILNQDYNLSDNSIRQQIAALFLYRSEASTPYYDLTYKYCDSQAAADAAAQRKVSEDKLNVWRTELQNLSNDPAKLDEAITKAETYLRVFQSFLNRLNDTLNTDCKLESTEITRINTHKLTVNTAVTNLNTALTSVLAQKKAIAAQKLVVQNYQDQLNLKLAGSTQQQIAYQEALLSQAEAGVIILQNQIQDAVLKSPSKGQIVKINKRAEESVLTGETMVVFLPSSPFQVKVDIYEEDIVNIKVGNPVDIKLTAFPEEVFKGKVIAIDPTEKLVDEVVYYKVTIDFDTSTSSVSTLSGVERVEEPPQGIKPGMTADIVIKVASRDNVLFIPKTAIEKKGDKTLVKILQGENFEEREIKIGLIGSDDNIEIISGLDEGEKVVITK